MRTDKPAKRGPSLWWLAVAGLIAVVCIGAGVGIFVTQLMEILEGDEPFVVPGRQTVQVPTAGNYVLWHHYRGSHQGTTYVNSPELPEDADIRLEDAQGNAVPPSDPWNSTRNSSATSAVEAARWKVPAPGEYTVVVGGFEEPHLVSFGASMIRALAIAIGALNVGLLVGILAPLLIVAVVVGLRLARRQVPAGAVSRGAGPGRR